MRAQVCFTVGDREYEKGIEPFTDADKVLGILRRILIAEVCYTLADRKSGQRNS